MQENRVSIIQPTVKTKDAHGRIKTHKKRVCAYARVSTDHDEQKTSFAAQTDEYTKRISENEDWIYSGIYADEGISGTSTKKRKEFNRMIADAKAGKFDMIITKSISRFARNTVDCLNFIRELRSIEVEIYFEKEAISSYDPKVDFLLTIMSSIAQEEARNISENIRWSVRKKFREGKIIVNHKKFLGYTKDESGNLVIVPEEAEIVKYIFDMYVNGIGPRMITKRLAAEGKKTATGSINWIDSSVRTILRNEKYVGDLLQQKTVTLDYLSHKRVKNNDLAPKYHLENSHPAIISREVFELAQHIMKDRSETKRGDNKDTNKYNTRYTFSSFVFCSCCGKALRRRYWNYGKPSQKIMLQCSKYITESKAACPAKALTYDVIEKMTINMLNTHFIKNTDAMNVLEKLVLKTSDIQSHDNDLNTVRNDIININNEMAQLIDLKIKTPGFSQEMFDSKYYDLNATLNDKRILLQNLETKYISNHENEKRLSQVREILDSRKRSIKVLDQKILKAFINRMISVSQTEVIYCIGMNKNYTDQEFSEKRFDFMNQEPLATGTYYDEKYKLDMKYRIILI